MPYPNWVPGDTVPATGLNSMVTATTTAQSRADAAYALAQSIPTGGGGGSGVSGVVQADSFAGANDGAMMTAALSYAAAQTIIPWVQLPFRTWNTGSTNYDMFSGMKICGAGFANNVKNLELGSNKTLGVWQTSCGTGASSLIRASATVQSVSFSNIQFYAPGNSSQIFRASGGNGAYPSVFHNLSLYGGPYFFGNPSEKFLTTQMVFSGHWTVLGYNNTPFTLGGGDCDLWVSGYLNSNSGGAGAGKPIVDLSGLGKTNIGYMYLTNEGDWVGLRVQGALDKHIAFLGGSYEGRSPSILSTRPVIDIQGGSCDFFGPWLGQVSDASGTVQGVIHQSGGQATFHGGTYQRGNAGATFPLLYQTGGTAQFVSMPRCAGGATEQIRVRWSDGTTSTYPAHSNGRVSFGTA